MSSFYLQLVTSSWKTEQKEGEETGEKECVQKTDVVSVAVDLGIPHYISLSGNSSSLSDRQSY